MQINLSTNTWLWDSVFWYSNLLCKSINYWPELSVYLKLDSCFFFFFFNMSHWMRLRFYVTKMRPFSLSICLLSIYGWLVMNFGIWHHFVGMWKSKHDPRPVHVQLMVGVNRAFKFSIILCCVSILCICTLVVYSWYVHCIETWAFMYIYSAYENTHNDLFVATFFPSFCVIRW
jgi:hypothetical protein